MNNTRLRRALGLCTALALLSTPAAFAQVSDTGTYTQNFDSMLSTGTTAPTGWTVVSESGSHADFAPANSSTAGVAPNFTKGTLSTQAVLTAGAPTTQKGIVGYNFDASGLTGVTGDRALGSSPSGNAATILELSLTNSSGAAVNSLNLSYDMDRFTTTVNGNGVTATAPNAGVEEYPGYQLFYNLTPGSTATWVNVNTLNPTIDAATTGTLNVPNSTGVTSVTNATVTLASSWAANATLQLAWFDDNAESPSPDQLIGLNNVSIQSVPEPGSGYLGLVAAGAVVLLMRLRRQRA